MELILQFFTDNRKSYVEWKQIVYAVFLAIILGRTCHCVWEIAPYKSGNMDERAAAVGTFTTSSLKVGIERAVDRSGGAKKEERGADADVDEGIAAYETAESIRNTVGQDVSPRVEKETETADPVRVKPKVKVETEKRERTSGWIEERSGYIDKIIEGNPELPFAKIMEGIGDKDKAEVPEKIPEQIIQKEVSGFICDGRGYITGYSNPSVFMRDGFVVLPGDNACTGIKAGAFKGLEETVFEIYIPANITYIEKDLFDSLHNLVFIEADPQNTRFYSQNGILYTRDGKIFAYPNRQM